jgi:membrane protease YdiL (CAAX protease family)
VKSIALFVAVAYGLSVALSLVVGLSGGYYGPLIGLRWLSMFLPGVAVVIVAAVMNEKPTIRAEVPLRYVPIALFLIPVVLHAAMLPTLHVSEGLTWQDWLTPQSDGLYHTPASRGWGVLTAEGLAAHIAINAVVGLTIASLLAFFEEVGWRAWLLPRLRVRMGARSAVVLTAIIWALWHVPFELSGIQHIDGISPLRLAIGFPVGILAAGLVLGWLWLRTESVWLCAIAHGSLNSLGQYAFKFMPDAPATDADLLTLLAGFLALLSVGGVLLWLSPPHVTPRVRAVLPASR